MRQQRPNNARIFVRKRHGGDIRIAPFGQTHQPPRGFIDTALEAKHHGTGTVDQQSSQIPIATFTDAKQAGRFASAAVTFGLARDRFAEKLRECVFPQREGSVERLLRHAKHKFAARGDEAQCRHILAVGVCGDISVLGCVQRTALPQIDR